MITSKGIYGIVAILELYNLNSDKPVQIKEISEITKIPQNYLEQLLNTLKKANLLKSVRGAHGGYVLEKSASNIKIIDILRALEGDIVLSNVSINNPVLELFLDDGNKTLRSIFDISLSQLESYKDRLNENINYTI